MWHFDSRLALTANEVHVLRDLPAVALLDQLYLHDLVLDPEELRYLLAVRVEVHLDELDLHDEPGLVHSVGP